MRRLFVRHGGGHFFRELNSLGIVSRRALHVDLLRLSYQTDVTFSYGAALTRDLFLLIRLLLRHLGDVLGKLI